jgi:4-hydroxybenzoate polyprenyltransferase
MGDAGAIKADEKISPLVVDLDGTLLRSNLLLERAIAFVREQPLHFLKAIAWALRGNGALRHGLAGATTIDVSVLPYDRAVIDLISAARVVGRPVVLSATERDSGAEQIAEHLQLFDSVVTPEQGSAACKRDALVARYGEGGFDYVGNARDDIPVWAAARQAYLVNSGAGVTRRAEARGNVGGVIRSERANIRAWAHALRLHQWVKNALIFVPLLSAHQLTNVELLGRGILAFILFGLCASSVYVLNDLLDLEDDRHHNSKRHRPFASGQLSIQAGLIAFPLLLIAAFAGAFLLLPWQFGAALGIYYILTLSYSLSLKSQMAVDVIALALLYTIRVIAGVAVFQLPLTFWLLAFSTFMFLSLALAKRYGELRDAQTRGRTEKARGRDYDPSDLEMISALGAAAGYQAVIVLALYVRDQNTMALYSHPEVIWLACPLLLFWVTRIWMLTHRGHLHDDPVVFAITDRVSLIVGALFCLVFFAAT